MKSKQIHAARNLRKFIGVRAAAEYLRLRGWSLDAALYILLGK